MPVKLEADPALSPNRLALAQVRKLIDHSALYRVAVHKVAGATVVDCGAEVEGGYPAGLLLATVCLGGLAEVALTWADFDGLRWPAVEVRTDHPLRACLASQYAGWAVQHGAYFAMGSGPLRALLAGEELFQTLNYRDDSEEAVLCLETRTLPDEDVVNYICQKCGRRPEQLYLLIAPTASMAGSLQIAARSVETGLHKMLELGYDLGRVEQACGVAPLPALCCRDGKALGRTNDAILYGATVHYTIRDGEALAELAQQMPASASPDYGVLFQELMARYDNRFYDIDPLLFSPAEVWLNSLENGRTYHGGGLRGDLLRQSFQIEL